jgi:hypothetical protein
MIVILQTRQLRRASAVTRRRKNQAKPVGIAEPKDPRAPGVSRLGIEYRARALGVGRQGVDILCGRDLERESFSLHAINPFGPIVLRQEDSNRSCPEADSEQPAIAFKFLVNRESEGVAIPRNTASKVGHREGRLEALRE